ncbi:MFS transporter [Roseicyclus persicicus]|uniref:TCR/Tet family MFS transporter n=1 Tax=Roseicyclus persicicus TaxID=2650661 RepID=A0A7X6GYE7_9RHOB|nr:MFS transporter [Roseibacterium persicicum]NKX44643.1 TCR/Tet family MFS transporter [Roseibacterium persicicum]
MRLPLVVILATVALDTMAVGLILPVMPGLIGSVRGLSLADAALWGGILSAVFAVSQFACAPALGALSDRFGRRPVLLVSLVVMAADMLVMALAQAIWLLLVARIVAGIAASTYATALAYVADITPEAQRARSFGLVSAAMGAGVVLGPVAGGLLGGIDPRAPFWAAAVLAAGTAVFAWMALPESLPLDRRRPFDLRRANPVGALWAVGRLPGLRPMIAVFALLQLVGFVYPAVWAFYVEATLGWTAATIGASLALYGTVLILAQTGLVPLLLARLGEVRTIRAAMLLGVLCLVGYGLADRAALVWALIPLSAVAALATPVLQGLISRSVGADRQGEVQGVLGSLAALSMILSPLIMTQAFFWGTGPGADIWLPGAPFLVAASILGVAVLVFVGLVQKAQGGGSPTQQSDAA